MRAKMVTVVMMQPDQRGQNVTSRRSDAASLAIASSNEDEDEEIDANLLFGSLTSWAESPTDASYSTSATLRMESEVSVEMRVDSELIM